MTGILTLWCMLVQLLCLAVHTFIKDGQLPLDEMVQALHSGLEPQHAAQEFQHTSQSDMEKVPDQWLARTFMIAFGQDQMSLEKGKTLLHVHSGTGSWKSQLCPEPKYMSKELYMVVKNEGKC